MIEKRLFGRTGHDSSATIFGGAALGNVSQADADRTLDVLLQYGVNHLDTAASYGDSELRIGPWMRSHRQDFFLATKTGKRGYAEARDEFRRSLERLKVDSVDLLQLHALIHPDEWELAMSSGGALDAAIEAKEEGLARFIGVTGHGWTVAAMHRKSLLRFDFDAVLLPYNFVMMQNDVYRRDFEALETLCKQKGVAIQTIKSIARGPWATRSTTHDTWYEPLEQQEDIDTAVHWALGRKGVFLNTVGDIHLLPKVLEAASRFQSPPEAEQMAALERDRQLTSLFGIPLM